MLFPESRPDVIQAINQRWLLKFWNRHLGEQRVPRWKAVEAENLTRMADNFSFLDVAGGEGGVRFVIRYYGPTVIRVYGLSDPRGRYLDEVAKTANCPTGLKPYHRAVETGRPVYTISPTARAGWFTASGCCCHSQAMASASTGGWRRSNSSRRMARSTSAIC
jgi:hypothetical protein